MLSSNLKPTNSLEDELKAAGLDFSFWSEVLKAKLGLTNKEQINYMDKEDYQLLKPHIRYRWEEKAFQKLFGISEPSKSEGLEKTQEKSTPTKEQQDVFASLKACEDHITKNSGNAKDFEAKLKYSTDNESKCSPSICISDEEVLRTSSGGLALQGIFKSDRVEDLLKDRQQLIKVDTCKLVGPRQNSHYNKYEFSCHKSHKEFFESVEKLGYSYSVEHNLGFPALQAKFGLQNASMSSTNASFEHQSEQAYVSETVCHYIPVASTFIEQPILSDSAKKELMEINELLHTINENEYNPKLLEHAERFFQRFGSHVSQGPIHFGGTFWWKAYAQGFSDRNHNKVKNMVHKVLEKNCSVKSNTEQPALGSHHLSISKDKGASHNTFCEELNTKVQFFRDKFGGPSETDDHTLWKNNLATSNKTWAVIDRGSTLTPVWYIIRKQHKDQFKDPLRLCTFLMKAYEKITHQQVETPEDVKLLRIVDEAKKIMLSVQEWSVSDAESHLRDLLKIKNQIKECTTSFKLWVDDCLSNEALQKFLTDITQYSNDNLRFMTYLVMETHCHQVKKFPNREQILKWVRGHSEVTQNEMFGPIYQFYDVQTVLEKACEDFQQISEKDKSAIKDITCKVTHAINSWIESTKEGGHNGLVLLVQSVTKLVGYREDTFHTILGSQEIDFLKQNLSDVYKKYLEFRKESSLKAQAFSLLTMLTATYKGYIISSVEKQKSLDVFKQDMKTDIIPDLEQAIADFTQHVNWELFEKKLGSMIGETYKLEDSPVLTGKQSISENNNAADSSHIQDSIRTAHTDGFSQLNIGLACPYKKMFEKLDLLKYYPAKISNAHIININMSMCIYQVATEKELWLHFIYKLLTLDVNVRFLCLEPKLQVSSKSQSNTLENFISFQDESAVSDITQETHIHPMDICMAVFHCSNDFVRQIVFRQLLKCQFAVPLLVPNLCSQQIEIPLWPLQISAHTLQAKEQSAMTSSILDISSPVVTFMRLGTSRTSKSKIMNDIINKNGHPTFFSRHCRGSTTTRLLLDGVAEISWYFPEGKTNDIFGNYMAFINLHGDACHHPQQVQFLKRLSSVIILLLPENLCASVRAAIDGFLNCETPLIALFSGKETIDKGDPHRIAAKNRNEAELTKEIIFKCNQCLSCEKRNQKLTDHFDQAKEQGFMVGTEIEKQGRLQAEMLINKLYGEERKGELNQMACGLKDVHLPLQGDLWKWWCTKDKQFHCLQHKRNMSIEQHRAKITEEKQNIREEQQKRASPNTFMKPFLQYVVKVEERERLYFLNWFKKCLDDALTSNLVELKKQYNRAWLKYREALDEERSKHQINLCEISSRIKHATFGLQHVFREISQLYESHKSLKERKTIHDIALDKLPETAVDLMLSGHPLELMDGDVNYIPIDWVSAVLNKVTDKLGDKRVLVLSVVGLQSSGKSTLLNTMFGLNFAVSSGPCTRGAFMHLLPVTEQMRDQLLFDFILVLDTEGLRSTETDPDNVVKHDNELATLIIGISDITLINVMGENLCEIQNILQVCFQAFLRMKLVNIKPSCVFVHQNVSDITAKENNQGGRIQLIEKLDEISRAAAEEENKQVLGFSDIINFNVNTDVFYFKNLLEGDPPMAPPNPSYSQNVQELKKRVLSISEWQPNCARLTLSELSQRVKDIWNALLNENFVFNFRNSLDMKVYSNLQTDYQRWSWKLRKKAIETQRTFNCKVKSGELSFSEPELKSIFESTHEDIKMEVDKYFREQKHSNILSQWRVSIDRRLEILMEELTKETYNKVLKEVLQRKLRIELDSKMRQYEADLFQKSMAAASTLRDQTPSEDLIQTEFNKHWTQWTSDLSSKNPKETETDIQIMVENAILSRFEKHKNEICKISEEDFQFDSDKHVKKDFGKWIRNSRLQKNESGHEISKYISETMSKKIHQKAADGNEVNENFIHEVLEEIDEMIQTYQKSNDFQFTSFYKASISAFICKKETTKLRKLNEDFKSANDPLKHLMNQKQNYFQLYKRYCQGAELVKTFVSVLTNKLKEAMKYALYDKLSIDIVDFLSRHHAALRGNKSNLEHHIMKHLAEKENFEEYMVYIHDPKSFCREFIRECVIKYINDEKLKIVEALTSRWSELTEKALVESSSASETMRESQGNASMWLDQFCSGLGHQIPLSREDLRTIENVHIDNSQILQDLVARSLKEMLEKTKEDPKSLLGSGPFIFKLKEKPVNILFEQLSGCWEQCPFCKAVCLNTIPNHPSDHTVEWHRCQAIGGLYHHQRPRRLAALLNVFTQKQDENKKHFVVDFCSTSVISDNEFKVNRSLKEKWVPFKNYRDAGLPYSTWEIKSDNDDKLYWKWFICTFQKQLEEKYKFKFEDTGQGIIPEAWKKHTKDDVLNEINSIINHDMNRNQ